MTDSSRTREHLEVLADALATPGEGAKHDAECRRRKVEWDFPYLCTCALSDEAVRTALPSKAPR